MDHGKNIRSPSLEQGTKYKMKTWGKVPVYFDVTFDGFVSGGHLFKQPNKQLKDMLPGDYYKLTGENGAFKGKMLENCLVHETSESRITFFHLAGVVAPEKPAKKSAKAAPAAVAEVPAAPAPEAPVETAKERKNRLDRERKAAKRNADKAAKEAANTAPAETEIETKTDENVAEASVTETETVLETVTEDALPATEDAEASEEGSVEAVAEDTEHFEVDIPSDTDSQPAAA